MPLTPADVAAKQFRLVFRGYSPDETDAFLDEVESELTRLLQDNADLRRRLDVALGQAGTAGGTVAATADAGPAQEPPPAP